MKFAVRCACWLPLLVAVTGCGSKPPSKVDMAGQVLQQDGKAPTEPLVVIFDPQETRNAKTRPAALVQEGRFQDQGLPGRYKISVNHIGNQGAANPAGGAKQGPSSPGPPIKPKKVSPAENTIPPEGKKDITLSLQD